MMASHRARGALALALSFIGTAACNALPRAQGAPPGSGVAQAGARAPNTPGAVPRKATPAVAPAPLPPPPVVTLARPGEPTAALAEARLATASCSDLAATRARIATERIRRMREELKESFRNWANEQPTCWLQFQDIGESYGSGGLGLSGIGEGGGGYGEGVGLGTLGTVGYGAAVGPRKAASASGTNNQVASVDEADIVKTDGRYVYLVMNGALRIVEALSPRVVSVTKLGGSVRDLFLEGDRAVVYTSDGGNAREPCTYGYDCTFAGDGTRTKILVFDVEKREAPRLTREIRLSGSFIAARRIGDAVHTVVSDGDGDAPIYDTWPQGLEMCGTKEARVRQRFAELERENERKIRATSAIPTLWDHGVETPLCNHLLTSAIDDGSAFTTLVSFDMKDDGAPATTATVMSRPGAVFASADALYLSVTHQRGGSGRRAGRGWYSFYPSVDEVSDVHKFRIGERPAATRYVGSGVVPGHVLNQFAMDQYYGYLRIATTRGRVPDPNVESAVSILAEAPGGNLVRVGAVEGLGKGEDIRSVRFDEERGYVVTFKKTDPLFVLDLYRPDAPRVLGELKIPGFSSYIHRLDATHLLSIGFDADDHGSFAYFDGLILQLFDVKNPMEPRLLHKEKIGTRGSSSEAATNHLAFNYFAERGLLALPMTICKGGGDGTNGNELSFSGLLVYRVDIERGFERLGGIDHGKAGVGCSTWWSNATSLVKRSLFLDELVYSIASDRLKVQRLGHLGSDVADIALDP